MVEPSQRFLWLNPEYKLHFLDQIQECETLNLKHQNIKGGSSNIIPQRSARDRSMDSL